MYATRGQRGAIVVTAVVALALAVAAFGVLGLGQNMWQKREIQKIADAAARTAASQLGDYKTFLEARQIAAVNGLRPTDNIQFLCQLTNDGPFTDCSQLPDTLTGQPPVVRVRLERQLKPFFLNIPLPIVAFATAEPAPIISAAISTSLVKLNTAQSNLINGILNAGRPAGSSAINLNLVNSEGLLTTNVNVDALRLSTSLGVLNVSELAGVSIRLGDLLDTGRAAVGAPNLNNATGVIGLKEALNAIPPIRLGDILRLDLSQQDAAQTLINLGDLAIAGLLGSVKGRSIDIGLTNVPAGISLKLLVVEAPRVVVAQQRRNRRPVATLVSGQVKLEANFSQNVSSLLNALSLGLLGNISLLQGGIYVQAAGAEVQVDELFCKMPRAENETHFSGRSALVRACLSDRPSNFAEAATTPLSCSGNPAQIVSLRILPLLGSPITVSVNAKVDLNRAPLPIRDKVFGKDPLPKALDSPLGSTLTGLINSDLVVTTSPLDLGVVLNPLLGAIRTTVLTELTPLLNAIGGVLDGILSIPGIAVNESAFDVRRLDCSGSRLVQ